MFAKKILCFFLLLFATHFSPGLGPLSARYCTHRPSNSSGLQMFTPGECLHCGGSLRPHPSTIKSHSEGELTLSSCQLCSVPELSVHWCYPANTRCALPKNLFAQLIREKTELTRNCKSGLGSKLRHFVPLFPLFTHWLVSCFCSEMKMNTHEGQFSGMGFVVTRTGLNGENTSGPPLPTPNSLHPTVSMTQETSNSASKQAFGWCH